MAYVTKYQPLYDAFNQFKERCLLQDRSLLWPDKSIWTLANLQRWKTQVIERPNLSDMKFTEKLEIQLTGAIPELWAMTADLHYIYYLPSTNITIDTRKKNISWAAEHAGLTLPPNQDPIWNAQMVGFTRTAQKYHFRYLQLRLLTTFALRLKEDGNISQTLSDPGRVQSLLDEILDGIKEKTERAYDMRHAILYLMFPERYERCISTGDKEKIVGFYSEYISNKNADLDGKILQIRNKLSESRPEGKDLDFYDHLKDDWRGGDKQLQSRSAEAGSSKVKEDSEVYGLEDELVVDAQRLIKRFKNLILFGPPGTGKTYWANQIANKIITPQLQKSQSKITFFQTVIQDLPFYDTLALSMYAAGPDKKFLVPQLEAMELVQARFRQYPVKNPKNQIWGYLQAHTAPESQTVKISSRTEPYLFDKTTDSHWFLTPAGKEYVKGTLADRLDLINQGPPAKNVPEDFIRWITFHQSYSYEDFVEGLKPKPDSGESGNLSFELKPGTFRNICSLAQSDPENQYVLVIDEINRGNIAKVFGELMTLIEADKRGSLSVELPYSKDNFQVPQNLAIIGTMNTADRSIALLDVALRRRFAFLELLPKPELLDKISITVAEEDPLVLGYFLRLINQRISEHRGSDYQIGHSYFLPLGEISSEEEKLACLDDLWNYQVVPLLKEYFYGQFDSLKQVLPSFFVTAEDDTSPTIINLDILHGEDLVAALNRL